MYFLSFAPNAGYVLSELKIDGNAVTTASSYEFTNVSNNHTITATFSPISYTISYNLDGGTVTGNPTSYTVEDAITLVNPTKDGYNFTGWTENISTSNWYEGFINYSTGVIETNSTYPNAVYSEPIFIKANTTYTASGTSLGGIRWRGFDSSGNYLGGISNEATCTPTQDCYGQILLIDGCTEANRNAMIITSNAGTSVTIPVGSTGDRTYTANWEVAWPGWNEPVLAEGLTPVNWNGSSWTTTTESNWDYNYNSVATATHSTVTGNGDGKWANAQTADGSLYVWIPRYSYKITSGKHVANQKSWNSLDAAGTAKIEVKFSNGTTDDTSNSYIAHPAFTFGTDELKGIWVAKYEASQGSTTNEVSVPTSSTSVAKFIPGATSWGGISVSKMFEHAYNTYRSADSHLMKNVEWGAVAYLTNAIGRIPYINNYYVSNTIKTGYAGNSQNAPSATSTSSTYAWNTANGVKASTTHNVYGIYDMSGASWEYASAYYPSGESTYLLDDVTNKAYIGALYANRNTKYVEQYTNAYDSSKKGDALYETSSNTDGTYSWDNDGSYLTTTANPNYLHGGDYADGAVSGLFCFSSQIIAKTEFSFRAVLAPETNTDYYVTFNSNGGTGTMISQGFKNGVSQKLVNNQFSKEGYKFTGWSTTQGGAVVYVDEANYTATGNATLYAVWEVAGREFIKTTTLVDGATYIVCSDTNALQNNSGSIASSTVSVVNDKITTADKTIMWTYSGGKLINDATGTIYYLKGTSSAVSLATVASQTDIRYDASSSKLKVAEGQSSGYPWGGYYGTTSYYLVYNSGFTVSTSGSTITLYAEEGLILNQPTATSTLNSISVRIKGIFVPSGGTINYKLYIDNNLEKTLSETSGKVVTLSSTTSFGSNTLHNYYVEATLQSDTSIISKTSVKSIRTMCTGTTYSNCSNIAWSETAICQFCNGSGNCNWRFEKSEVTEISQPCPECSWNSMRTTKYWCTGSNCDWGGTASDCTTGGCTYSTDYSNREHTGKCTYCGGDGRGAWYCNTHGASLSSKSEKHCEHGYTSSHTITE